MHCVNCGNEVQGKYCPECGQRAGVKRITLKETWFEFWSRVYGFDGMFPRTLRDLTIRPGLVARRFIGGNRALYYGPVGYFFLMVTLFLIVAGFLEIDIREFLTANQSRFTEAPKAGSGQEQFNKAVIDFVSSNIRFVAFAVIPFNAMAAKHLLFRKSGFNILEHAVLPCYLVGHVYWVSIIGLFVYKLTGSFALQLISSPLSLFYFGFAYTTLIENQPRPTLFFKGALVFLLGQLMMLATITLIVIMTIVILYYVNPDALELIRPSRNQ